MNKPFYTIVLLLFVLYSCNSSSTNTANNDGNKGDTTTEGGTTSWAWLPFVKVDSENPILQPGNNTFTDPITNKRIGWEAKNVFNPAIAVRNDTVFMLYRAQDSIGKPTGTSRIGLAASTNGIHFTRYATPVLYPQNDAYKKYEWEGGCEDPRMVQDSAGRYYMTYTAYDGKTARLMVATSPDMVHWTKHGPVFAKAYNGKYVDKWSKSGSIVSTYQTGKITAIRINGKYWMYWGDLFIWAATSDDLINWTPVEMQRSEQPLTTLKGVAETMPDLQIVIPTRKHYFDNDLVESGPPAMLTDKGILLLYNSRSMPPDGDSTLKEGTYTAGQVLLDKNNPTKILQRLDHYFMQPERPYELTGEVNNVCFIEGLAQFKGMYFLYYGTADSKIAVAVKD
jgi:predicted GH43/DUF377 family glycosyl hydrolase